MIELTLSELRVLKLLADVPRPLGYFGVATRLELSKRLISQHVQDVLDVLVTHGLVTHSQAAGYRHGAYTISEFGREYLAREFGDEEA